MKATPMQNQSAFTLFEMMVTLALVVVIVGWSAVSLKSFFERQQSEAIRERLTQLLHDAREQSRARYLPVGLCVGSGMHCSSRQIDSIIIFSDVDASGAINDAEQKLSLTQIDLHGGVIYMRAYPHYRSYLRFMPENADGIDNGSIWYCSGAPAIVRWALVMSRSGKIEARYPDKNGILKDSSGKQYACRAEA